MILGEDWRQRIREELPAAIELRHRVHADPRLSGDEADTTELVTEALLAPAGDDAGPGDPGVVTATTGRLLRIPTAGTPRGAPVVLRSELDALPIDERTGAPYAATNGAMHACGHDVHLAATVAVARAARTLPLPLPLQVLLQPREESLRSGARDVLDEGFGSDFGAIIGAHVQPRLPAGRYGVAPGAVNAGVGDFEVLIEGRGGHSAYPHTVADPVLALAAVITASQQISARRIDPTSGSVLMITMVEAGSAPNVVPETARAMGTYRFMSEEDRLQIEKALTEIVGASAAAHGTRGTVRYLDAEPTLINDPRLASGAAALLASAGRDVDRRWRSFGSDDFAYFGREVPSLMIFVGTGEAGGGLHDARFLPPDSVIIDVADALVAGYLAAVNNGAGPGDPPGRDLMGGPS